MKKLIMIITASIVSFGAFAEYPDNCVLGPCETNISPLDKARADERLQDFYNKIPQRFYE